VVRLVADGMKDREIAERLKVSEHSIRNYLYRIFDKLVVSSRVELILYAFNQRDQIN
jgi:DNA-binding NarL/FixJ family response regulator